MTENNGSCQEKNIPAAQRAKSSLMLSFAILGLCLMLIPAVSHLLPIKKMARALARGKSCGALPN